VFSIESLPQLLNGNPQISGEKDLLKNTGMHFSQAGEDVVVAIYLNYVRPKA